MRAFTLQMILWNIQRENIGSSSYHLISMNVISEYNEGSIRYIVAWHIDGRAIWDTFRFLLYCGQKSISLLAVLGSGEPAFLTTILTITSKKSEDVPTAESEQKATRKSKIWYKAYKSKWKYWFLHLGSRDRAFESPHSDQNPLKSADFRGFLLIPCLLRRRNWERLHDFDVLL